jgi:hypothetical protein
LQTTRDGRLRPARVPIVIDQPQNIGAVLPQTSAKTRRQPLHGGVFGQTGDLDAPYASAPRFCKDRSHQKAADALRAIRRLDAKCGFRQGLLVRFLSLARQQFGSAADGVVVDVADTKATVGNGCSSVKRQVEIRRIAKKTHALRLGLEPQQMRKVKISLVGAEGANALVGNVGQGGRQRRAAVI